MNLDMSSAQFSIFVFLLDTEHIKNIVTTTGTQPSLERDEMPVETLRHAICFF